MRGCVQIWKSDRGGCAAGSLGSLADPVPHSLPQGWLTGDLSQLLEPAHRPPPLSLFHGNLLEEFIF